MSFTPLMSARRATAPFQMEYKVEGSDTLERIAARFECTVGQLMKLNKMSSRMVFAGQTLIVPSPVSDEVFEESKAQNGLFPSPGTAVPVTPQQPLNNQQTRPVTKTQSAPPAPQEKHSTAEADVDCLQRFLKVKVKHVTEKDGTVSGTLLVTPNALMFDPDVTHPLVKENGQDLYIMMARMEEIMSVAVFKDIGALTGEKDRGDIYDPAHISQSAALKEDERKRTVSEKSSEGSPRIEMESGAPVNEGTAGSSDQRFFGRLRVLGGSDSQLPLIAEEEHKYGTDLDVPAANRRTVSDVGPQSTSFEDEASIDIQSAAYPGGEECKSDRLDDHSEITPSTSRTRTSGKIPPLSSRNSLMKLGRTLSAHANSIRDSAEKVTQSAVTGTKSVAHGVVTHTRSAAETLQTGIQSGAKLAASHAKVAVDAMVSMPQGIVSMGTGLFSEGQQSIADTMNSAKDSRAVATIRRQQSLATLETLKQRTLYARELANKEREAALFTCATSPDDKPDLFRPVQELLANARKHSDLAPVVTTELPYYMAVRLNRKKPRGKRSSRSVSVTNGSTSSGFEEEVVGNRVRREFWFAIPRDRVDSIYHFLLQWNPDKYGEDASLSAATAAAVEDGVVEDSLASGVSGYQFSDNSFIVLDAEVDEKLAGEKPTNELFGSSYLNREWEIVTVEEVCRRLSLNRLEQLALPIPDGATSSQILDETMIRKIMNILPPRAEGYPWVNIYSSEKHGFSLFTLYRRMQEWDEELSPILLLIRDCNDNVFGFIASTALRPCEHYVGTGDSCLLFKFVIDPETNERELQSYTWTGENQFFVKASKDSLSMGAGGGHFGLWLDADLNHGRSLRCETFDNDPLSDDEDFNVQFLEAYGFKMS